MNENVKPKPEHFVRVLRGARILILRGAAEGLCYALALGIVCLHVPCRWRNEIGVAEWMLRHRIKASLGVHTWVDNWLHEEHGIPYETMTEKRMKAYRLRWIDALIAEYEGK